MFTSLNNLFEFSVIDHDSRDRKDNICVKKTSFFSEILSFLFFQDDHNIQTCSADINGGGPYRFIESGKATGKGIVTEFIIKVNFK